MRDEEAERQQRAHDARGREFFANFDRHYTEANRAVDRAIQGARSMNPTGTDIDTNRHTRTSFRAVEAPVPNTVGERLNMLGEQMGSQIKEAIDIVLRLEKFADTVLGPTPEMSAKGQAGAEQASLCGRLEDRISVNGEVLARLRAVAARIGA